MTLNESTGLFSIRRSLHFELKPVAGTADFLGDVIADNEDRAAGLNSVKDIILAQHLTMIRRVFKSLYFVLFQQCVLIAPNTAWHMVGIYQVA